MKLYLPGNYATIKGILLLLGGSAVIGITIGILAYLVSTLFYLLIIFPAIIAMFSVVVFEKLLLYAKVKSALLTACVGLLMGILISITFYSIPYIIERHEFIKDSIKNYQVSETVAASAIDQILREETGSGGLVGYMKLRAQEGDEFTNYMVVNAVPVNQFTFSLRGATAWLYWLLETLIISLLIAWIGYDVGKRPIDRSIKNWYNPSSNQIGSVSIGNKASLLAAYQANDLQKVSELIVPEGEIPHPVIEIYTQSNKNYIGNVLVTLKQTTRVSNIKVKRKLLQQWEISQQEYTFLDNLLKQKTA